MFENDAYPSDDKIPVLRKEIACMRPGLSTEQDFLFCRVLLAISVLGVVGQDENRNRVLSLIRREPQSLVLRSPVLRDNKFSASNGVFTPDFTKLYML